MMRMKEMTDKLQARTRQYTGENLTGLDYNDLIELEHRLEIAADKVRNRKVG